MIAENFDNNEDRDGTRNKIFDAFYQIQKWNEVEEAKLSVIRQGPASLASYDGSTKPGDSSELIESESSENSCLEGKFCYSPRFVRKNQEKIDLESGNALHEAIVRSLETIDYNDYSEIENQKQSYLETKNVGWKGKNKLC